MKRDYRQGAASLLVCSVVAGFALIPTKEVELFQNSGFEDQLVGWKALNMSQTCQFEIDRKIKKSGKASLRIERGDGTRPDFLKQFIDLDSDAGEVSFSAMARVEKFGAVRATLLFADEAGKTLGRPEVGSMQRTRNKWKELSGTFQIPEGSSQVGVNFWFSEPGVVWLDDVSLEGDGAALESRKGVATSLTLANGEFSKGLNGWSAIDLGQSSVTGRHERGVGKGCLLLEGKGNRLLPLGGYETRALRSKREKRVKLSYSARAEKGVHALLSLQALGPGGELLGSERIEVKPGGKRLQAGQLKLEVPRGTTEIAVVASMGGQGRAWFDDFELGGK